MKYKVNPISWKEADALEIEAECESEARSLWVDCFARAVKREVQKRWEWSTHFDASMENIRGRVSQLTLAVLRK